MGEPTSTVSTHSRKKSAPQFGRQTMIFPELCTQSRDPFQNLIRRILSLHQTWSPQCRRRFVCSAHQEELNPSAAKVQMRETLCTAGAVRKGMLVCMAPRARRLEGGACTPPRVRQTVSSLQGRVKRQGEDAFRRVMAVKCK